MLRMGREGVRYGSCLIGLSRQWDREYQTVYCVSEQRHVIMTCSLVVLSVSVEASGGRRRSMVFRTYYDTTVTP